MWGQNFEKVMFVYILKQEIGYLWQGLWQLMASCLASLFWYIFKITMKWLWSSSLCITDFCTKTGAGDKIKYYRLSKNIKTQHEIALLAIENTSYRQLKQTGIKAVLVKMDFLIIVRTCDFTNGNKSWKLSKIISKSSSSKEMF